MAKFIKLTQVYKDVDGKIKTDPVIYINVDSIKSFGLGVDLQNPDVVSVNCASSKSWLRVKETVEEILVQL